MDVYEKWKTVRRHKVKKIEIAIEPFDLGCQLGIMVGVSDADGSNRVRHAKRFDKPVDEIAHQEMIEYLIQTANELLVIINNATTASSGK